jgi:hypothetical protein
MLRKAKNQKRQANWGRDRKNGVRIDGGEDEKIGEKVCVTRIYKGESKVVTGSSSATQGQTKKRTFLHVA